MAEGDRISVLIPLFNAEKYIECCLESVLSQDYEELEIIVLDDGSTDDSAERVKSFSDGRLRYYRTENRGVSSARNTLLSLSSSPLVLFVDADDILSPGFISSLKREMDASSADAAAGRVVPFRGKERMRKGRKERKVCTGEEFVRLMVKPFSLYCYPHSRLMKKSLFEGMTFPEGRIFEDVFVMPRVMLKAGRVVLVGEAVYNYRINSAGLSHGSFREESFDEMDAYLSNVDLGVERKDREIVRYSGIFFLTKYHYYYWRVILHGMGIRKYRERYKEEKTRVRRLMMEKNL